MAKDHFFEFFSVFASHIRSRAAKPAKYKNLRFLQIITLSDETRAQIQEAAKGVYESIKASIDSKVYNAYLD